MSRLDDIQARCEAKANGDDTEFLAHALKDILFLLEIARDNSGEWRENPYLDRSECTVCGKALEYAYRDGVTLHWTKYCPNCGARMLD